MSRTLSEEPQSSRLRPEAGPKVRASAAEHLFSAWAARVALVLAIAGAAATLRPFGLPLPAAAAAGSLAALLILLVEARLRRADLPDVVAGFAGALGGTLLALLATLVIYRTSEPESNKSFFALTLLLGLAYLGFAIGARKGSHLYPRLVPGRRGSPLDAAAESSPAKLLDTSVLIDGRIADICEANFLDGPLLVPPFVLDELQAIADSSDTLRRQRGRRGLEVLQRIQKLPHLEVRVLDIAPPLGVDVDHQLVELARRMHARIVTNDFNLNKVASVQGISVLNVNELANALRPAVLPGESMRVFILREGKEAGQGVAYLEDGTMVVVDGARRLINKTVDMTVTSVHQTPAGKMIFGRFEDRVDQHPSAVKPSTAGERGARPASAESELQ